MAKEAKVRPFSIMFMVVDHSAPEDGFTVEYSISGGRIRYYGTIEGSADFDVGEWTIAFAYVEVNGEEVWKAEPWEVNLKEQPELHRQVEREYKALRQHFLRSLEEEEWLEEVERRESSASEDRG